MDDSSSNSRFPNGPQLGRRMRIATEIMPTLRKGPGLTGPENRHLVTGQIGISVYISWLPQRELAFERDSRRFCVC